MQLFFLKLDTPTLSYRQKCAYPVQYMQSGNYTHTVKELIVFSVEQNLMPKMIHCDSPHSDACPAGTTADHYKCMGGGCMGEYMRVATLRYTPPH